MYTYQEKKDNHELSKKSSSGKSSSINLTGIPNATKLQYEQLSGFSFDDVRVHYNSDKPSKLKALAYTQGNQVYIKSGQERHLWHELSHVVQQKQGIVNPTTSIDGVPVNDDPSLEAEADNLIPIMSRNYNYLTNETVKTNVVQRIGERNALRHIMGIPNKHSKADTIMEESKGEDNVIFANSNNIRRGNLKSSILSTRGNSAYIEMNIIKCIPALYKDIQEIFSIPKLSSEQKKLIRGELSFLAGAGNCNEFAAMTFSHLVEHTEDQWVYVCKMIPDDMFDHTFTLTSKIELDKGMVPNQNLDKITVVDGWHDYIICNLEKYCNFQHPYINAGEGTGPLKLVPNKNLKITAKSKASSNVLPEGAKEYIKMWYDKDFPKVNVNLSDEKLKKLFDDQGDKIFGNEIPIPRVLKDLRLNEEILDDLDLESADIEYMPLLFSLLLNGKEISVANKLRQLSPTALDNALNLIKIKIIYSKLCTTKLMNLLDHAFLDKIDVDTLAILFNYDEKISHKENYIKYLWGYGFSPDKSRIRKILLSNQLWANDFIKTLPTSGLFGFTQKRAADFIKQS